jgi:enoyl-CoA hydratase/carnithine racemase
LKRKRSQFILFRKHVKITEETATEKSQEEPKPEEKQPEPEPTVLLEKNGSITLIGINRAEVRNCINSDTASKLTEIIEQFENDEESPVGILHGIGGNFCAGYDLKELSENKDGVGTFLLRSEGAMGPTRRMIRKPLIAAVSGYCVAGGMELALMCDLRVMESDAIMGFYNRRFGVPLIDGGTVRLAQMIGLSKALDLVLTGRQVTAKEACEMGLANRVVACGTALGQALNLASSIAKFPQQCLLHDRESLYNAVYNAKHFDEAMDFELMSTSKELLEEAKVGAIKFTEAKIGRHGSFADLKERDLPDWEKEEILREKDSVVECKPPKSKL